MKDGMKVLFIAFQNTRRYIGGMRFQQNLLFSSAILKPINECHSSIS